MNHSSDNLQGKLSTDEAMGDAFLELIPRFSALCAIFVRKGLIQHGYEVQELINDFYLDVWPGVKRSFDPKKGDLGGFSYVAFRNFLLKRSAQISQNRHALVDIDLIKDKLPDPSFNENRILPHDKIKLDNALRQISKEDKKILLSFFDSAKPSIRAVAQREGMKRYATHKKLIEAFGRVLMAVNKPDNLSPTHWKVCHLILINQCTVPQIAYDLKIRERQVRTMRKETMSIIADLLKKQLSQ